jgi:hypothetical protein
MQYAETEQVLFRVRQCAGGLLGNPHQKIPEISDELLPENALVPGVLAIQIFHHNRMKMLGGLPLAIKGRLIVIGIVKDIMGDIRKTLGYWGKFFSGQINFRDVRGTFLNTVNIQ